MKTQEARDFGNELAHLLNEGEQDEACARLAPRLAERTPFRILDLIGGAAGAARTEAVDPFLDSIAAGRSMGGWVVIGAALSCRIESDLDGAFARCRHFIAMAEAWYAADSLGERLPGPALVARFDPALAALAPWREDPEAWVRRTAGVAVHFWAKRAHGAPQLAPQAGDLLDFLEPLFSERHPDAAKGVGWGLKTLGRYYPDQAAAWLEAQTAGRRPHRSVILRKALTYLPAEQRLRVLEKTR